MNEKKKKKKCAVAGCKRPFLCKDLCRLHYSRKKLTGSTEGVQWVYVVKHCKIKNCDSVAIAKSLCPCHYKRKWYAKKRKAALEMSDTELVNKIFPEPKAGRTRKITPLSKVERSCSL